MSPGAHLWLRLAVSTAVAVGLLAALAPAPPDRRVPRLTAILTGVTGGTLLYALAARRVPRLPRRGRWPTVAGKVAFFGVSAANEEIVWRGIVLGALLSAGVVPALAASSAGFALLHRGRAALHLGTGLAFGGLYLATGALATSVTAHWTYNVLVGGLVERARERGP